MKISWTRLSGLSSSILISSRMTLLPLDVSLLKTGLSTRSERTSRAMGTCSSRTFRLKQMVSFSGECVKIAADGIHRGRFSWRNASVFP